MIFTFCFYLSTPYIFFLSLYIYIYTYILLYLYVHICMNSSPEFAGIRHLFRSKIPKPLSSPSRKTQFPEMKFKAFITDNSINLLEKKILQALDKMGKKSAEMGSWSVVEIRRNLPSFVWCLNRYECVCCIDLSVCVSFFVCVFDGVCVCVCLWCLFPFWWVWWYVCVFLFVDLMVCVCVCIFVCVYQTWTRRKENKLKAKNVNS